MPCRGSRPDGGLYARAAQGLGQEAFISYNLGLTMVVAAQLWVGWFGFNAGSAGAADGRTGMALLMALLVAATDARGWMLAAWVVRDRPAADARSRYIGHLR